MVKALLLAAGKGERIQSLSHGLPKPLLHIGGKSILLHNLELLAKYGVKDVWINLHSQADKIKAEVETQGSSSLFTHFSYEKKLLGTAGALKKLQRYFKERVFFVLYGDNLTNIDLQNFLNKHRKSRSLATIALYDPQTCLSSKVQGGKVRMNAQNKIVDFIEGDKVQRSVPGTRAYVNAGIYALEPEILAAIPKGFSDFGKDIFPKLLQKSASLSGYIVEGYCLAVDTPAAYARTLRVYPKTISSIDNR